MAATVGLAIQALVLVFWVTLTGLQIMRFGDP
jgi:hypothetical protein